MRIAFLDFAAAAPFYAIVSPERVHAVMPITDPKDENMLLPLFDTALKQAGVSRESITHVACVTGPGGFVSLRVGVALANALAHTLGVPSAGVHASDLWRARMEGEDGIWLHSTRKDQLFIRGFGRFAKRWPEPMLISVEEAIEMIDADVPLVGELIPGHEEALEKAESRRQKGEGRGQKGVEEVLPELLAGLPYKTGDMLRPWYGREA